MNLESVDRAVADGLLPRAWLFFFVWEQFAAEGQLPPRRERECGEAAAAWMAGPGGWREVPTCERVADWLAASPWFIPPDRGEGDKC